jgi:alpha-beta hydrolase superfamily lysophospholipase
MKLSCLRLAHLLTTALLMLLVAMPADCQLLNARAKAKRGRATIQLPINVPYRSWLPSRGNARLVVLCVHGLGLNSASFARFGWQMSARGVAVFAVDVRGFGAWMKREGKQELDFKDCLSDVQEALTTLHKVYPKLPVYLLGESMGGAIALRVTADHPELVDGLISAVPSGDRFHKTRNELQVAMRMVTGRMKKPMEIGSQIITEATDDPAVQERWKDDPLNRMELTPKDLLQFQRFMSDNHDEAKKIDQKPVLMIAGFKDKLVKPQGTIDLFNELATTDKMLIIVGNGEHLIFEENQMTRQVAAILLAWLNTHSNDQVMPHAKRQASST